MTPRKPESAPRPPHGPLVPLEPEWFGATALSLAPLLVGRYLVREDGRGASRALRIVETEAYMPGDPACHAYGKVTARTRVMYGPAGVAYVYLIYGMHHCLNFVTGPEGSPQAVLIRALEGPEPGDPRACAGPGKLCKALGIDLSLNARPLQVGEGLYVAEETPPRATPPELVTTTRVGISQAKEFPWRWYWKDHPAVSVKARSSSPP